MMDTMEGEDSLQGVRSIFEKAIIATGLHVTEVGTQCIVVPKIPYWWDVNLSRILLILNVQGA